jgi:hypothetical protein
VRADKVIITRPHTWDKASRCQGSLILEAKDSICVCDSLVCAESSPDVMLQLVHEQITEPKRVSGISYIPFFAHGNVSQGALCAALRGAIGQCRILVVRSLLG